MNRTVGGELVRIGIEELRLDWRNPRLPPEQQHPDATQAELALYIDKRYNPLEVAQSIARHGYFESEPLIAVREDDAFVVVEGNRRLTALLGLSDTELKSALARQTRGWARLNPKVPLPDELPVVVVPSRESISPLLGFRHISGIKEWEPFAQARYIADLVEEEGHGLEEVAELVGRPPLEVKAVYRDHEIVRQADEIFHIDVSRAVQDFGVFNAAMGIRNLRVYIGAPTPARVDATHWPLDNDRGPYVNRLFVFIYGDSRGRGRVLPDSRLLKDLGRVLADPAGRAETVLRESGSLSEAVEALTEPDDLALKRLNTAASGLRRVVEEGPSGLDWRFDDVVTEIANLSIQLKTKLDSSGGLV